MKKGLLMMTVALLASGVASAQSVGPDAKEPTVMIVQGAGPGPVGPGGPGGPGPGGPAFFERFELMGVGEMHGGKVVTGAPFSATAISESTQTLPDGNKISRKTQTSLYRDGQGRFRKETTLMSLGPLAADGQPKTFIAIQDPVAGKTYLLEVDKKIARLMPAPGKRDHGPREGEIKQRRIGPEGNAQKEDLGTQTISGVSAQGTRYTTTIPAGQIGNEKPIMITSESWYSPDLQMLVMSKRSDPRFGDTTYQLTNIQRTEPAASLFAVPAGYTIESGPPKDRLFQKGPGMPPPPPDAGPQGM